MTRLWRAQQRHAGAQERRRQRVRWLRRYRFVQLAAIGGSVAAGWQLGIGVGLLVALVVLGAAWSWRAAVEDTSRDPVLRARARQRNDLLGSLGGSVMWRGSGRRRRRSPIREDSAGDDFRDYHG